MESKELRSIGEFTSMMFKVFEDAQVRLRPYFDDNPIYFSELDVYSWPQQWSDTTCGFPGIGGQAITSAQTVVLMFGIGGPACVYHAGRFAYLVKHPGEHFWMGVTNHRLPGASDTERIRRLEHEADDD